MENTFVISTGRLIEATNHLANATARANLQLQAYAELARQATERGPLTYAELLDAMPGMTTRKKKRIRRSNRRHAARIQTTLPERAAVWRKRARNG